ncbi:MAG TPA: hypothetical protein VEJ63_04075 [Planctomycetota bacterium]|nr:hypothetical protein [Planctomycetota bacterium]
MHVKALLLVVPATLAIAFIGVRQRHLMDSSEGRVARVAQEMLQTGNWVVPHLNGEVRKEKPAFSSWCVAATAMICGSDRVEPIHAFIPPGLAALGLVLLAYAWAARESRTLDHPTLFPVFAAVILAGTPGFLLQARSAELDMLLAFFVGLTYWGFYTFRTSGCKAALLIGYVALALGIHTKAHVALILTVPPLVLWHIWERNRLALTLPAAGAWRWHLIGIGLVLLLVVPYAITFIQQSDITWADFNREGGTARFDESKTGHQEPFYWYFIQIPGWFLPWFLLLPLALIGARNEPPDARSPLRRLCWLWFGVNLIVFSLLTAKQRHYAVPFFFPLAILIADGVERFARSPGKLSRIGIGGIFLVLAVAVPILAWPHRANSALIDIYPQLTQSVIILTAVLSFLTAVVWMLGWRIFATWWLVLVCIVGLRFLIIESKDIYEVSPKRFCDNVRRLVPDDAPLYDFGVAKGSVYRAQVLFYLGRRVTLPELPDDSEARLPEKHAAALTALFRDARETIYVLTNRDVLSRVSLDYEVLTTQNDFLGHTKKDMYDVVLICNKSEPRP